ncbi:MAG: hypothetical protein P8L18_17135 [Verrucomicrobiota bacterium]|nr:hypothetical protein [Verrucomicrobiota bacterium]
MKNHKIIITLLISAFTTILSVHAQDGSKKNPAFEKMKTILGKWEGTLERAGKKIHLQTQYRLIGGGVSIVEDWIEDGEEMITVYHNKNGQLNAIHFCALGNAPAFTLSSMRDDTLTFTFDPICGLNATKERFVTRMVYRIKGDNPTEIYSEGVSDGLPVDGEEGEVVGKVTLTKVDEWSKN